MWHWAEGRGTSRHQIAPYLEDHWKTIWAKRQKVFCRCAVSFWAKELGSVSSGSRTDEQCGEVYEGLGSVHLDEGGSSRSTGAAFTRLPTGPTPTSTRRGPGTGPTRRSGTASTPNGRASRSRPAGSEPSRARRSRSPAPRRVKRKCASSIRRASTARPPDARPTSRISMPKSAGSRLPGRLPTRREPLVCLSALDEG